MRNRQQAVDAYTCIISVEALQQHCSTIMISLTMLLSDNALLPVTWNRYCYIAFQNEADLSIWKKKGLQRMTTRSWLGYVTSQSGLIWHSAAHVIVTVSMLNLLISRGYIILPVACPRNLILLPTICNCANWIGRNLIPILETDTVTRKKSIEQKINRQSDAIGLNV